MRSRGRKVPPQRLSYHTRTYNLQRLKAHWWSLSSEFNKQYKGHNITFDHLIMFVSDVLTRLEHKARLPENCTYLLSKGLNHSLSAYSLTERGLIIDGALCARNAIETCLMVQLFAVDETGSLFEAWSKEKEFSPGEIRKKLSDIKDVLIGDIVIKFSEDHVEDARQIYSRLSEITHANLASLRFSVVNEREQNYRVMVGGSLVGQEKLINAIFGILCHYLLDTAVIAMAVFDLPFLEESTKRINALTKDTKSTISIAEAAS